MYVYSHIVTLPCYHPSSSINHRQIDTRKWPRRSASMRPARVSRLGALLPGPEIENAVPQEFDHCESAQNYVIRTCNKGTRNTEETHETYWNDTIIHHRQPYFLFNGRICSSLGKPKQKNIQSIHTCCVYPGWPTICCLLHLATEACLSQSCKGKQVSPVSPSSFTCLCPELCIYTGSNQDFCPCLHRWSWPNSKCANFSNFLLVVTVSNMWCEKLHHPPTQDSHRTLKNILVILVRAISFGNCW